MNKKDKYIAPKDNETHDETRKRRRTIRESIETEEEKILRLANDALRKKRKWAEEKALALGKKSSEVEIASIDVTNILLKACGVREEDICSQINREVGFWDTQVKVVKADFRGTRPIPYQITKEQDDETNEFFYCQAITSMPQYAQKSFEELRLEDYLAGNKGEKGKKKWQLQPQSEGTTCGSRCPRFVNQLCIKCGIDPKDRESYSTCRGGCGSKCEFKGCVWHSIKCKHSSRCKHVAFTTWLSKVRGITICHETCGRGCRKLSVDIDDGVMEQLNITGDELRRLANDATGAIEGLKMNRTICVFFSTGNRRWIRKYGGWPGMPDPHVDPVPDVGSNTTTLDIEHIREISNGRIVFDLRAEFESFEITGAGGSPVYATAKVNGASYNNDPWYLKQNLHHFPLPLKKKSRLPKDNIRDSMMSAEVGVRYSNLQPTYRPRDWGSRWMSVGDCYKDPKGPGEVFIEKCGARHYKFIDHYFGSSKRSGDNDSDPWGWMDGLVLRVKIGPMPTKLIGEKEETVDSDPYQMLQENPNMSVSFHSMSFYETNLKKGQRLHGIVCDSDVS